MQSVKPEVPFDLSHLMFPYFHQIHLEFAKCNEIGRFTNNEVQMDCAMFHLEQAAACGDLQALVTMAEIYLQLPHDILASATVQVRTSFPHRTLKVIPPK